VSASRRRDAHRRARSAPPPAPGNESWRSEGEFGYAARSRTEGPSGGGQVGGTGPCVGLLELASIAAGFETTDALRKEAAVQILRARAVSPGKFVILFTGTVEDTTSALRRGLEVGRDDLIDSLLIPNIEPTLLALMRGGRPNGVPELDAVGIIETLSVASTVRAADIAAKTASLQLLDVQLAVGLGGKSYVTLTGEVGDVTAAVEAGAADAERAGLLVRRVVIPRPHGDMAGVLGA
jgi:microcompartment protein CcmL/EutN